MLAFTACSSDQIIADLGTAQTVAVQAQKILAPTNPEIANVAGEVATDLGVVIKAYGDYETAAPGDKPTKAALVQATAQSITANLGDILTAVKVKNPAVLAEITVFVQVANTAVVALLHQVPAPASSTTQAQAAVVQAQQLPVLSNAKSAADLKRAWNDAVKKSFPKAKI